MGGIGVAVGRGMFDEEGSDMGTVGVDGLVLVDDTVVVGRAVGTTGVVVGGPGNEMVMDGTVKVFDPVGRIGMVGVGSMVGDPKLRPGIDRGGRDKSAIVSTGMDGRAVRMERRKRKGDKERKEQKQTSCNRDRIGGSGGNRQRRER